MKRQAKIQWIALALAVFISLAGLAVAIGGLIYVLHRPPPEPKPLPDVKPPCSTAEQRCIKITIKDGKTFELNDFQFFPPECIAFDSLPDGEHHYYCGEYKLDWIGPDPTKGQAI